MLLQITFLKVFKLDSVKKRQCHIIVFSMQVKQEKVYDWPTVSTVTQQKVDLIFYTVFKSISLAKFNLRTTAQ